jgi:hypothetical protein
MAAPIRAYRPLALALALAACGSAQPLHNGGDGAAGAAAGAGGTSPGNAGQGPDAAAGAGGFDDDAGAGASGLSSDGPDEAAAPPAPDAGPDTLAAPQTYEAETGALFGKSTRVACPTCSNGQRVALAPDSGVTLSNLVAPEAGTDAVVIYYTNADTRSHSIYVGVNGTASQMLFSVFPPTGGAGNVSSISVPLSGFNAGSNNTLTFFIDTELPAPDLDRIVLLPTSVVNATGNACVRTAWKASASVTGGDGGGPAAGIDGNLTTRWANNRPQNGSDWYEVDFGAFVKLAQITLNNTQAFPNDYPGSYAIYASLDGVQFEATPFVAGAGTPNATVINFSQRTVRAIKIAQVGAARSQNWWQIGELQVICYQ